MAASTRARVTLLTLDSLFTTRETVLSPTPASAATSRMVAGRIGDNASDNVFLCTGNQHRRPLRPWQVSIDNVAKLSAVARRAKRAAERGRRQRRSRRLYVGSPPVSGRRLPSPDQET